MVVAFWTTVHSEASRLRPPIAPAGDESGSYDGHMDVDSDIHLGCPCVQPYT